MVRSLVNLILLSFAGLAASVSHGNQDNQGNHLGLGLVKQAFKAASIPQALSIKFNPKALLEVTFPEPAGPITLQPGIQLPMSATAGPPSFSAVGQIGKGPFVVAAVDPDAPTPQAPVDAQIRHFLGANFFLQGPSKGASKGASKDPVQALVNSTAAISEFLQPMPPPDSDPHRYTFLLFNQPANFNSQTFVTPNSSIFMFNIAEFAVATGLGDPIAGTFMLVDPDPMEA